MKKSEFRLRRALGVAFASMVLIACAPDETPERLPPLVRVKAFTLNSAQTIRSYPGEVAARYQNLLSFQVGGRLQERNIEVGDLVEEGQVLALLDARDYHLASENRHQLVAAAKADLARAAEDLKRIENLRKDNFMSQAELDAVVNRHSAARATLDALRAQHEESLNRQGYTSLRAKQGGVITQVLVEAGEVLVAGQPVATLAWHGNWEMVTAIPENQIAAINTGQELGIRIWALDNQSLLGQVREIGPKADPASRTFQVKIAVKNPPPNLRLGMSGYVEIPQKIRRGTVPAAALFEFEGQPAVFLVNPENKETRVAKVELGPPGGDEVTIVDGLQKGQLVVIAGSNRIKAGQQVRLLEE